MMINFHLVYKTADAELTASLIRVFESAFATKVSPSVIDDSTPSNSAASVAATVAIDPAVAAYDGLRIAALNCFKHMFETSSTKTFSKDLLKHFARSATQDIMFKFDDENACNAIVAFLVAILSLQKRQMAKKNVRKFWKCLLKNGLMKNLQMISHPDLNMDSVAESVQKFNDLLE